MKYLKQDKNVQFLKFGEILWNLACGERKFINFRCVSENLEFNVLVGKMVKVTYSHISFFDFLLYLLFSAHVHPLTTVLNRYFLLPEANLIRESCQPLHIFRELLVSWFTVSVTVKQDIITNTFIIILYKLMKKLLSLKSNLKYIVGESVAQSKTQRVLAFKNTCLARSSVVTKWMGDRYVLGFAHALRFIRSRILWILQTTNV